MSDLLAYGGLVILFVLVPVGVVIFSLAKMLRETKCPRCGNGRVKELKQYRKLLRTKYYWVEQPGDEQFLLALPREEKRDFYRRTHYCPRCEHIWTIDEEKEKRCPYCGKYPVQQELKQYRQFLDGIDYYFEYESGVLVEKRQGLYRRTYLCPRCERMFEIDDEDESDK